MGIRAERMTRMATIEIKMLGGFEIRVNGKPVLAQLAQSRKATALVQYLVLRRGERVSHKVLLCGTARADARCGQGSGPPTRTWPCAPSCIASAL